MPSSFDAAAQQATQTRIPVPRGVAFRAASVAPIKTPPVRPAGSMTPPSERPLDEVTDGAVRGVLPDWEIEAFAGLPDWFRALPPAPITLPECWSKVQELLKIAGVLAAEPLLLVRERTETEKVSENRFALAYDTEPLGLWGSWRGRETEDQVAKQARDNPCWHLDQLNVPAAWKAWRDARIGQEPGADIVIGHPDTGYTLHPEIQGRLSLPGVTFIETDDGPEPGEGLDDLRTIGADLIKNPGHGTGTASVIASRGDDPIAPGNTQIVGIAPGASVLPLRVSRSVVHFELEHVGRAILTAIDRGADVVSMSLGGPYYSDFARDCVRRAQAEGLIVIAAAGNYAPTTVFPAAFPEVIAVAATHAGEAPWRFSGLGRLVDIAAPGEGVWRAHAALDASSLPTYTTDQGTGTSFATACVAGLAALWLSRHGGREKIGKALGGDRSLVPFAFQFVLANTARTVTRQAPQRPFDWVGKRLWGVGIPDALALLAAPLPTSDAVQRFKDVILAQEVSRLTLIGGLFRGVFGVSGDPAVQLTLTATVDEHDKVRVGAVQETDAVQEACRLRQAENELLGAILASPPDPTTAAPLTDELRMWLAAQPELMIGLERWQPGESLLPLYQRLLQPATGQSVGQPAGGPPAVVLSPALRRQLETAQSVEERRLMALHRGKLTPPASSPPAPASSQSAGQQTQSSPAGPRDYPVPPARRLRAYAFDPSLEISLDTVLINQICIPTRWEHGLQPGPIGEYLEVVDVDPASGCAYQPVDLNEPHLLAQDGLPPSEGDPRFHQQMVYAVAMNTIHRFELALGRPVFWASLRPWLQGGRTEQTRFTPESLKGYQNGELGDRYVQRLRIYPHALREANAYYSPDKRALLCGYFPATADPGTHLPGGTVFTCLSHDIVAHETTHALLDGMHAYFTEPTNDDVLAFHEAFADIIALFQHFTFPEVVRQQIAGTRGDLRLNNLLGQLAREFGQATGKRGALRNYIVDEEHERPQRRTPKSRLLGQTFEPHERGGILVAAVFEAFLKLYENRTADLLRIASGGTGRLPAGAIHPDLAGRLSDEASRTAADVLSVCIRAMDYMPPVDVTFGDFLRALITADYDYGGEVRRQVRIAFIDGFRSWGIYPDDVTTLSEESLRWRGPEPSGPFSNLERTGSFLDNFRYTLESKLKPALGKWEPGMSRADIFDEIHRAQRVFHEMLKTMQQNAPGGQPLIPGLDLRGNRFSVTNLRPARRTGPQGEFRTEMVVDIVQTYRPPRRTAPTVRPFRGGATLVVDMHTWDIRYIVHKRLYEQLPPQPGRGGEPANRMRFQQEYERRERLGLSGVATAVWRGEDAGELAQQAEAYRHRDGRGRLPVEPFALLHRSWDGM